jgi:hypothetical protein
MSAMVNFDSDFTQIHKSRKINKNPSIRYDKDEQTIFVELTPGTINKCNLEYVRNSLTVTITDNNMFASASIKVNKGAKAYTSIQVVISQSNTDIMKFNLVIEYCTRCIKCNVNSSQEHACKGCNWHGYSPDNTYVKNPSNINGFDNIVYVFNTSKFVSVEYKSNSRGWLSQIPSKDNLIKNKACLITDLAVNKAISNDILSMIRDELVHKNLNNNTLSQHHVLKTNVTKASVVYKMVNNFVEDIKETVEEAVEKTVDNIVEETDKTDETDETVDNAEDNFIEEAVKKTVDNIVEEAEETVDDVADNVIKDTEETVDDVADNVVKETEKTEETVDDVSDNAIEETVDDVADNVVEETEKTEEAVDDVSDNVVEETEKTEETVNDISDNAIEETVDDVADNVVEETEEKIEQDKSELVNSEFQKLYVTSKAANKSLNIKNQYLKNNIQDLKNEIQYLIIENQHIKAHFTALNTVQYYQQHYPQHYQQQYPQQYPQQYQQQYQQDWNTNVSIAPGLYDQSDSDESDN